MGHIGYTSNLKNLQLKVIQKKAARLLKEAKLIEKVGLFNCFRMHSASNLNFNYKQAKIPTIGIGSSVYCDGQILDR